MKPLHKTKYFASNPLALAILTGLSMTLTSQAMAENNSTLPVKELSSINSASSLQELRMEDLAGLQEEHTTSVIGENGEVTTTETTVTKSNVEVNAKPFIPQPSIEKTERQAEKFTPPATTKKPKVIIYQPKKPVEVITDREFEKQKLEKQKLEMKKLEEQQREMKKLLEKQQQEIQKLKNQKAVTPKKPVITESPKPVKPSKNNTQNVETGTVVDTKTNQTDDGAISSIEKDGKKYTTVNLGSYAKAVNSAKWSKNMKKNTAMTVKLQALLDWNHASPGPIDGGWGMNSVKALTNFQAMKGLPTTGKMNQATWNALTKNIPSNQPVLHSYTITKKDVATKFAPTPSSSEAKSKMKGLYYQNIQEMFGERFHMNVNYLKRLNKGKKFVAGESITVYNKGKDLNSKINRVVVSKKDNTLYAYNGKKLVATYPTTVGSASTPSPHGTYKIINRVKNPHYKATVGEGKSKKIYMLPPGPNNPVGIVWMGLSKPTYGIHGSPVPEGISRQQSHGCIRLTNWDALEVRKNIRTGATVVLK